MNTELRKIDALRAANVLALVYGIMMAVFAILIFPFVMLASLFSRSAGLGAGFAGAFVILYPILGLVMGWLTGLLGAAIYNLVAGWTGGMRVEFAPITQPAASAPPPSA